MNIETVQKMCDEYDYPPSIIISAGKTYEVDIMGKAHEGLEVIVKYNKINEDIMNLIRKHRSR